MNDKIAVIGTGMMGSAIIKSLLKGGYEGKITAVDIAPEKLLDLEKLGVKVSSDNRLSAAHADIIFIIVKPGDVEKILKEISKEIKGKLVISVAATLYELIWKRMLASQMSAALYDTTGVEIRAINTEKRLEGYLLKASSSVIKFPGFIAVYSETRDEDERREGSDFIGVSLPKLKAGDKLLYLETLPERCITQPPPRYTEATLIKALEHKGIGRPSTYAPILSTIKERDYVNKAEGRFHPTELGVVVIGILATHFPRIVDPDFTARMEEQLDEIAQGRYEWIYI